MTLTDDGQSEHVDPTTELFDTAPEPTEEESLEAYEKEYGEEDYSEEYEPGDFEEGEEVPEALVAPDEISVVVDAEATPPVIAATLIKEKGTPVVTSRVPSYSSSKRALEDDDDNEVAQAYGAGKCQLILH